MDRIALKGKESSLTSSALKKLVLKVRLYKNIIR